MSDRIYKGKAKNTADASLIFRNIFTILLEFIEDNSVIATLSWVLLFDCTLSARLKERRYSPLESFCISQNMTQLESSSTKVVRLTANHNKNNRLIEDNIKSI